MILHFVTHPEVVVDPAVPVTRWPLSARGIERLRRFAAGGAIEGVAAVHASAERKAIEAAGVLAAHLGLGLAVHPALGENDRSATGFLPPPEFEAVADAFFARPEESVRGWERAVDAQARITGAVRAIAAAHAGGGDLLVVAHGAVGALLRAALHGAPISRRFDQPRQGCAVRIGLPGWQPFDKAWRELPEG
jgi:broad specificity phosphatase PhoE